MRYLILTVFFVVLISLCTIPDIPIPDLSFPQPVQQAGIALTIDEKSPDVFLKVEASSSEIRKGRDIQIIFEMKNKQKYDLRNVVVEAYSHPCFSEGKFSEDIGKLRGNETRMWTWKWKSDSDIDLQRKCPIRFRISYDADYSYYQDIAVLPDYEYFQRESEGTLKDIPIKSSSSNSPLNIQVTFSEEQPFLEEQDYYMYINYYNKGEGFFENVNVSLNLPNNIQNFNCADFGLDLNLIKPLTFIRNKATPSTCSFTAPDISIIDIKSLSLTATYKYVLDNSISITVKP